MNLQHDRHPGVHDRMPRRIIPGLSATVLAVLATTFSLAEAEADTAFSRVVVFGDSLSDTGNFYEASYNLVPPSPPYYQGRVSNGPIWIEHLIESIDLELVEEDQFAYLGAQTGYENFRNGILGIGDEYPGFLRQIDLFFERSGPGPIDPDALYVVWIGANDWFAWLGSGGNPAEVPGVIEGGVGRTAGAIARLAEAGARHIVVLNVPDLGLTPDIRNLDLVLPGIAVTMTVLSEAYNAALDAALDGLADAKVPTIRVDAAQIIRDIVADPAGFGLTNATGRALFGEADPATALFWDGVHPTTAGHRIICERALEDMISFYSPPGRRGTEDDARFLEHPKQRLNGALNGFHRAP